MLDEIDFIITTTERYDKLQNLLDSVFGLYPGAKVTIADQSKVINYEFYKNQKFKLNLLILENDCGLSFARNRLVKVTQRPYVLLLEDDFKFTKETKIEKLYYLMEIGDVVGGAVYNGLNRFKFEFNFRENGDTLEQVSDNNQFFGYSKKNKSIFKLDLDLDNFENLDCKKSLYEDFILFKKTQCIPNFFLAKRSVFDKISWNDKLKWAEHQNFFYKLSRQTNFKVLFVPCVKIINDKTNNEIFEFKRLKNRNNINYFRKAMKDIKFKKLK